ncbi:MAG: 50S ribosomal protein L11 methyltransferase [Pseudobdellovibrionaceae bacterium]
MNSVKTYFRIHLIQIASTCEAEVTDFCFKHQASGISEALNFKQPDLTYDSDVIHSHFIDLDVFFDSSPSEDFFSGLKEWTATWTIHEEEHKDWLEEWKKDFKPFCLAGPFWVVPSWEPLKPEHKIPLRIDPGMAFGTGTHATTKMMASFIAKMGQSDLFKNQKNIELIDVGTGTGILALLASHLGFSKITAIEIDPEARRVAEDNVLLNERMMIDISPALLEDVREHYDVVVANIIDGVLIKLKKDLLRVLKPGGHLLMTGILQERDNYFFENFLAGTNLKVLRRLEKEEWVGYWLQNP